MVEGAKVLLAALEAGAEVEAVFVGVEGATAPAVVEAVDLSQHRTAQPGEPAEQQLAFVRVSERKYRIGFGRHRTNITALPALSRRAAP